MSKNRVLRRAKHIQLKSHSENLKIERKIRCVEWHSEQRKFYVVCKNKSHDQPIAVVDPETKEIMTLVTNNFDFIDMKLTNKGDRLVALDKNHNLTVITLTIFSTLKQIRLSGSDFFCFLFADQSCDSVYVNDYISGLRKIDLLSGKSEKLNCKGFNLPKKNIFSISSDYRILFGHLQTDENHDLLACYNTERGFKYKIFAEIYTEYDMLADCLSKEDTQYYSGNFLGELRVTDLRSYKCLSTIQLENKPPIVCMRSKGEYVYAATTYYELVIVQNFHPFNLFYYQNMYDRVYSIGFSEKYLVLGGKYSSSVKIFLLPETGQFSNTKTKKTQPIE